MQEGEWLGDVGAGMRARMRTRVSRLKGRTRSGLKNGCVILSLACREVRFILFPNICLPHVREVSHKGRQRVLEWSWRVCITLGMGVQEISRE